MGSPRSPEAVARMRERCRAWAAEHRNVTRRQPWLLGAPPHGAYLPGGGCALEVVPRPRWPAEHRNVRALHGCLSAIHDQGHRRLPAWSLVPWSCAFGWGVYWRRTEDAKRFAGQRVQATLWGQSVEVRFSGLYRSRSPVVEKRGRRRLRIDAITPVCIAREGRARTYTSPTAEVVISSMMQLLIPRLDVEVAAEDIVLEVVEKQTSAETVQIGEKYGDVHGWVGHVIVETNAVGHWLLEAAARGPGLGGRTAFGFGRIKVTPC